MLSNGITPRALRALVIITLTLVTSACAVPLDHNNYAVVIDAGSSGTRVWVYKWLPVIEGLPEFDYILKKRTNPGISESADDTVKLQYTVATLIVQAAEVVPASKQPSTPVYLLATAGMRYLLEDQASEVVDRIHFMLLNSTLNPFFYQRKNNIRILSGEEEAAFAWIAVNYMKGAFKSNSTEKAYKRTYGVMEMGGASTQIAFVPKGPILAKHFPIRIAGERYPLYSNSYLHYGQDSVEAWIKDQLVNEAKVTGKTEGVLTNPCFNTGTDEEYKNFKMLGQADKNKCALMLGKLVFKAPLDSCHPKPCGVGTVYQPSISQDQRFYALSVFPIVFRELGITTKENTGPVNFNNLLNASSAYCQRNYNELKVGVKESRHKFLYKPCYMGLYVAQLLTKGYGLPVDSENVYSLEKINDKSVDWTLGALIYETQNSNTFKRCPTAGFSIGSTATPAKPSPSILILTIALLLYKLFPLPAAICKR